MIAKLARFANDSFYLWRTPHSIAKKLQLWLNLIHPSDNMMGFKIVSFDILALHHLYREIFARQLYFFDTNSEIPFVLDCGANIGMATLYFKWLYPNARVEAFEPDPTTFAVLQKNITSNCLKDVMAHNYGLWDQNTQIEFFVEDGNPGALTMSASASRLKGTAIYVPGRKLSEFIHGPIDLLKLDVEGSESRVLSDLVCSGKIHLVRQIVVEYHHHMSNQVSCLADFLRKLEGAGFDYQIHASLWPVTSKGVFQDILIGAYRSRETDNAQRL